eukprot:2016941-Amphidinium_carterae.1
MIHILNTLNYAADAPLPELPQPVHPPPPDFSQQSMIGAPPLPPGDIIAALARPDAPPVTPPASVPPASAETQHGAQPPDETMGVAPTVRGHCTDGAFCTADCRQPSSAAATASSDTPPAYREGIRCRDAPQQSLLVHHF